VTEVEDQAADRDAFAVAFREYLAASGLSVAELADASGVARWRITRVERGSLDPDFVMLVHLGRVLGVRPADMVRRADAIRAARAALAK
jgi:transcriptional regulator with XRE-family HTH domain